MSLLSSFRLPGPGRFLANLQVSRSFGIKTRHRGCVYVPRKVARASLTKALRATQKNADHSLLLPPFVSATELRVLFRLDYANTMRILGVRSMNGKYYWKDFQNREFESASKRKVLLPFDMVAYPLQKFGYQSMLVDVEPDWPTPVADPKAIPVVVVLGHINHGKTTLLDSLCGTRVAPEEPGGITQDVRAMTGQVLGDEMELHLPGAATKEAWLPDMAAWLTPSESRLDATSEAPAAIQSSPKDLEESGLASRMTFLDTPGHEAFELSRGRTMAAADVAVVVVSVERGAELQTEEVLMHASKWKVPVIFALNKIDLPDCHLELTRAELRRQCQLLHEHGLADVDWTQEAEQAIPISALWKQNLEELVGRIRQVTSKMPLPLRRPISLSSTPGEALRWKNVAKRTDFLQGVDGTPSAIALILEVDKAGEEQGEMVLTALVKAGRLVVGQFFVVGTSFGRITNLSLAAGVDRNRHWSKCETATVGVAVQLTGVRTRLGGDCAVDDLLFSLPRERAWRLCEHRQRIEQLMACQVAGPPLEVAWESDATIEARTQAAFERDEVTQPEAHSGTAYERRWQQAAVEEVSGLAATPTFDPVPRRDFARRVPLTGALESPETRPDPRASRFQLLSPKEEEEDVEEPIPASTGGRKSSRRTTARPVATGAWSADPATVAPERDFVYYMDRKDWSEEAQIDSGRVQARWQFRDVARWEEEKRKAQLRDEEKLMTERLRQEAFGETPEAEEANEERRLTMEEDELDMADDSEGEEPVQPLPRKARVVPIILKTKSVSQFDMLMEEIERVGAIAGLRIVIVHGGLGPVIPKDVVHAEVEKRYGYCPIYAFQVGVNPAASGQAAAEQIDIRRFNVFTELLEDLMERCGRINQKKEMQQYINSLRQHITPPAT
ncbi:unnamed protein product [Durusdinium trenchii]|uniref:Tr-type G domain-containing protein n=1 Tax=Durusdinium trenchii TaxID=1381693 RepID=A0ABP0P3P8_9DINO